MSVTKISDKNKFILWGKAAGRCQYEGCNKQLYLDPLTKAQFNQAYIAHIIADKENGPRGDKILSPLLQDDLSNLMLLCDTHHRMIDKEDEKGHPVVRLTKMKADHEQRIELVTAIQMDKRSHVVLYGANIGNHTSPLSMNNVMAAMIPKRYPSDIRAFELQLKNSVQTDKTPEYWENEERNLIAQFKHKIEPLKALSDIHHFSVFSFAPQPLLIKLGTLFSDIYEVDVYQRQREPIQTWQWGTIAETDTYSLIEPSHYTGKAALVLSLSATITDDRIHNVLGSDCSIWKITIPKPNNDFLKTKDLLGKFRILIRAVLDRIKSVHGHNSELHLFPAMPISAAIELGRVWMPKADLPLIIYDENNGFKKALFIQKQ